MAKAPSLPAILIANDLLDGDVIFLGASGWERDLRSAAVAQTTVEAEDMVARAAASYKANTIVDPYLVVVAIGKDGLAEPLHYREKMRTLGPTTRPDLGKQATR